MSYLHRMPLVPESPVSCGPHQQVDGIFLELPPRKFTRRVLLGCSEEPHRRCLGVVSPKEERV